MHTDVSILNDIEFKSRICKVLGSHPVAAYFRSTFSVKRSETLPEYTLHLPYCLWKLLKIIYILASSCILYFIRTRKWRKLHNEELHNLCSSPNRMIKSRRMRWAGHVARIRETKNACMILVGKPERKRPLGRPRHRWVDNIKIYLRDTSHNIYSHLYT
jgi:hypothetical protein